MNSDLNTAPQVMKVGEEPPPLTSTAKLNTSKKSNPAEVETKAKAGNRFGVLNTFLDVTMMTLKPAETAVWMLLFRDTKPNGLARTAQADLARRAGTTLRTVERAVKNLELRGLLTVVRRGGLRQGPSSYRVHALVKDKLPLDRPTQPDAGVGLSPDIARHLLPTPTSGIPERDQKERSAPTGATAHRQNASSCCALGRQEVGGFNHPASNTAGASP